MDDVERLAERLRVRGFRGAFMRQLLPGAAHRDECGIINLGDSDSVGTHWTCYVKDGDDRKLYFDSFGNAEPPLELVDYLGGGTGLMYNTARIQDFDDPPICGHLCLEVLRRHSAGEDWVDIERSLRNDKFTWLSWFIK